MERTVSLIFPEELANFISDLGPALAGKAIEQDIRASEVFLNWSEIQRRKFRQHRKVQEKDEVPSDVPAPPQSKLYGTGGGRRNIRSTRGL